MDVYWQSQDKMKFDFSINETKKIEVKTTTSETRKHKFKHEQLKRFVNIRGKNYLSPLDFKTQLETFVSYDFSIICYLTYILFDFTY